MKPSTRSATAALFRGLAWLSFAAAGLAFWFGGGIIKAITGRDRILAETEGIVVALVCAAVGVMAKAAEDRLEEGDGPKSLGEAPRK